jgi:hypothetical protein
MCSARDADGFEMELSVRIVVGSRRRA